MIFSQENHLYNQCMILILKNLLSYYQMILLLIFIDELFKRNHVGINQ